MRRFVLIVAVISVLALGIASAVRLPTKLIFNGSPSAPVGFYWIDDRRAERGDYVLVRTPEWVRNLMEERRYLPPNTPLIKRVAGA
ncbi:MAG: S26 family signal peptidase, partial [Hyphomicrobiales bacterium]|nr:S26 family signal peptidase [Hyphomicrobiales bacterium]